MKRKIFLLVLLTVFCSTAIFAQPSVWNGGTQIISNGAGTPEDPYLIENAQQWAYAAYNLGGYTYNDNVCFRLMTDLDLTPPSGNSPAFTGTFKGFFDGNNKTIANFKHKKTSDGVGLFYATGIPSTGKSYICNLGLISGEIETTTHQAGGIVGINKSCIINCYNKANVTAIGGYYIAGIAGYFNDWSANSWIDNCFNLGKITCEGTSGGIIGRAQAGFSYGGTVYNAGSIDASSSWEIGAVAGRIDSNNSWFANAYYDNETTGVGAGTSAPTGRTTAQMKTASMATELQSRCTYPKSKIWLQDNGKNNGYPYLNNAYRVFLPTVSGAVVEPVDGYDPLFAYENDIYPFTVTPNDPCMGLDEIVVECGGETLTPVNNVYTIPSELITDYLSVTVSGTFVIKQFTFDINWNSEGGDVTHTNTKPLTCGDEISFTITPEEGYVAKVKVNGVATSYTGNTLKLSAVSDLDIVVTFEKKTFDIMLLTSLTGGTIVLADGSVKPVPFGDDCTFNFIPNTGYEVEEVYVDGNAQGAIPSYTFIDVRETHSLEVIFEVIPQGINNPKAENVAITYKAGILSVDAKGLNIDKVSVYTVDGKLIAQQQGFIGEYPVVIVALEVAGNQLVYKLSLK